MSRSPVPSDAASTDLEDPCLYVNRELSLLEFQRRVLEEARDVTNPLLERVKFLAILGSNLDEFFMVRVAGLRQQIAAGVVETGPDGMTPAEQLEAIRRQALELMTTGRRCLIDDLLPALAHAGLHLVDPSDLDGGERDRLKSLFDVEVFPVLTPLAVDPGRPFPHISNLSLNLAVTVLDTAGHEHFARVKVPGTLSPIIEVPRGSAEPGTDRRFVWLERVVATNLDALFPGMSIVDVHPFRVTRNADILIQELEAADLLGTIEEGLRRRQFGLVTRVTVNARMPRTILEFLVSRLDADAQDVYVMDGPLALSHLMALYQQVDRPDLKETPFQPALPPALDRAPDAGDIFAAIRMEDVLLHHPFDSFSPVLEFLRAAARDPDVLAIKMTLYRVGRNAPVVQALLEAREEGKQVSVLVELKARFDEERNIEWARALEHAGVHVVYGLLGLKTHSKVVLVVRREGDRIRRYVHLSTGNYNVITAQAYTDLGLLTCDDEIGADATDLFNYLTGYSAKIDYRKLLVAPVNLRERFEGLIRREIEHQRRGRSGHLIFKMNALADRRTIALLYEASRAGVRVDLIVRGICCLRPGLPEVSDTVRVRSIVGRFLEHSRIFWFRNGGDEQVWLGSADLMPRNINHRVEVLFPVEDPRHVEVLRREILQAYLEDNVKARSMLPDGRYERTRPADGVESVDAQARLLKRRAPPREI